VEPTDTTTVGLFRRKHLYVVDSVWNTIAVHPEVRTQAAWHKQSTFAIGLERDVDEVEIEELTSYCDGVEYTSETEGFTQTVVEVVVNVVDVTSRQIVSDVTVGGDASNWDGEQVDTGKQTVLDVRVGADTWYVVTPSQITTKSQTRSDVMVGAKIWKVLPILQVVVALHTRFDVMVGATVS
jgi:hypothetical protein